METSKIKNILDAIVKVLQFISGFLGKKTKNDDSVITDVKQDGNTNKEELTKVNDLIRKKLKK